MGIRLILVIVGNMVLNFLLDVVWLLMVDLLMMILLIWLDWIDLMNWEYGIGCDLDWELKLLKIDSKIIVIIIYRIRFFVILFKGLFLL